MSGRAPADGRWLAGRRAAWLASWAGRWALGAGGSVELDENPAHTMSRELQEEWSVAPERLQIEALIRLPSGVAMLVGQAWLADGRRGHPGRRARRVRLVAGGGGASGPTEADAPLRAMATLLGG